MLSDIEVRDLARRMSVPLVFCSFKDNLARETLQYNKGYIVNMESTTDPETGKQQEGSHYVCFQCNRYPSGEKQCIYFDSYGMPPPEEVKQFCEGVKVHFNTKDIQSVNGRLLWLLLSCFSPLHQCLSSKNRPSVCRQRSFH